MKETEIVIFGRATISILNIPYGLSLLKPSQGENTSHRREEVGILTFVSLYLAMFHSFLLSYHDMHFTDTLSSYLMTSRDYNMHKLTYEMGGIHYKTIFWYIWQDDYSRMVLDILWSMNLFWIMSGICLWLLAILMLIFWFKSFLYKFNFINQYRLLCQLWLYTWFHESHNIAFIEEHLDK